MSSELKGKVALVTGASRGLGEGAARALAAAGAAVMLVARDGALARSVAKEIAAKGGRAEAMACDVSDYAAIDKVVAETKARLGGLDILVNNAGVIDPIAEIATSDPAAWAQSITINLVGAYNVVRAVLPGMLAVGGGSIVNVSSGAAYRPLEGWSAYCSGKAGLAMLTRTLAAEYSGRGIRVFGFAPGLVDTAMQEAIRAAGIGPVAKPPREKLTSPREPAEAVAFLCSHGADRFAGQELDIRNADFRAACGLAPLVA